VQPASPPFDLVVRTVAGDHAPESGEPMQGGALTLASILIHDDIVERPDPKRMGPQSTHPWPVQDV
jgi:hypothetical protein